MCLPFREFSYYYHDVQDGDVLTHTRSAMGRYSWVGTNLPRTPQQYASIGIARSLYRDPDLDDTLDTIV